MLREETWFTDSKLGLIATRSGEETLNPLRGPISQSYQVEPSRKINGQLNVNKRCHSVPA